jgi:metallo-beta-lactamase family protein
MKISFHGAAHCVTGSKHLLELSNGYKILLDCGMFQGNPKEADALNRHFGFEPAEVDCVILSHAHIDHSGAIPRLVNEGFTGTIYCTEATLDLTKILLLDSAHIHEADARYVNKKRIKQGKEEIEPLYTTDDVYKCLPQFKAVKSNTDFKITDEVSLLYTDAGHIIGSAVVNLTITDKGKTKHLTFSGDVGRYNDAILKSPEVFPQADIIILESTYGNSLHENVEMSENFLLEIIAETCLKKRGNLIIPSFSVGRTQEIVYALNRLDIMKKLPEVPFYVDSPLSVEATDVMKKHKECFNSDILEYMKQDPEPFDFANLHYITEREDSMKLNTQHTPCVIISASGMADAGRIKHHIKHNIGDERNTILLVGYCEPNSLGGKLMRGNTEVTIFGEPFYVKAEVKAMRSLSAHGDYDDLMQFLACQKHDKVEKLFLVHGEYEVQQAFQQRLLKKGFSEVIIPELHSTHNV